MYYYLPSYQTLLSVDLVDQFPADNLDLLIENGEIIETIPEEQEDDVFDIHCDIHNCAVDMDMAGDWAEYCEAKDKFDLAYARWIYPESE